ncbi:uncharacterized protein LACBIDRAFT_326126 [Laccaria bicolor S238N-H82]|uniref:Predicted protein n=1 Tax=Laccaria bicolor (strain S238N-H82 / ATCC MYA-4686) TaxID=486041 RepID=B0D7C9_LACBS|nr:uncharacterized protein LACBIDRAFT_326126 [Laccaria bicolor S238N-H82]EDR09375.1 predicted protein [Laccaria bicolor S238N-H82]|eukprot:XP_001879724.1 predicted protein [Laccaria bicolor S238N-H82]
MADLKRRIEAMEPGSEERKMGVREWRRLKRIPQGSVENGVIRSYLEWLTSIPWPNSTHISPAPDSSQLQLKTRPFLAAARAQLDADHFGLEKIKKRLIEYLAVVRLKELNAEREAKELAVKEASQESRSAKAAQEARNIEGANAQETKDGKELVAYDKNQQPQPRVQPSLGKPSRNGKKGVKGPIFLFVGPPGTGKTSLGQSVAKALDRPFQRISLGGVRDEAEIRGHRRTYVASEKIHIARRFLLPKQLQANGLDASQINITEPALLHITTRYTREAGVRSLERAIGGVVRYKAVDWALDGTTQTQQQEGTSSGTSVSQLKESKSLVEEHELEKILGIARWDGEEREREERRGVVYGLVVMGQSEGGILPVETIAVPGSGKLKLTGSLGDVSLLVSLSLLVGWQLIVLRFSKVIKESGELALSWVKRHAYDLCITNSRTEEPLKFPDPIDIHLHLPAGAQKKDGPSAGVAMTCAFVSLTGTCVPANIAMTGEITLRDAHRAQVTKVILPWANRKDVEHDVLPEIPNEMEFVFRDDRHGTYLRCITGPSTFAKILLLRV